MSSKTFVSDDSLTYMEGEKWKEASKLQDQKRRLIDKAMRNRISSLKYGSDHKLGGLMQRWFQITM